MKFRSFSELRQLLPDSQQQPHQRSKETHDGKGRIVSVVLDTKGRKGKSVTVILGFQHNPNTMKDIARMLKEYCGSGGTVKDGVIELQGDQRLRVAEKLRAMNYVVQ